MKTSPISLQKYKGDRQCPKQWLDFADPCVPLQAIWKHARFGCDIWLMAWLSSTEDKARRFVEPYNSSPVTSLSTLSYVELRPPNFGERPKKCAGRLRRVEGCCQLSYRSRISFFRDCSKFRHTKRGTTLIFIQFIAMDVTQKVIAFDLFCIWMKILCKSCIFLFHFGIFQVSLAYFSGCVSDLQDLFICNAPWDGASYSI